MAAYLIDGYAVNERRACRVIGLPHSTHRSRPSQARHVLLVMSAICRLSNRYLRFGYRMIHINTVGERHCVRMDTVRLPGYTSVFIKAWATSLLNDCISNTICGGFWLHYIPYNVWLNTAGLFITT